MSEVPLFMPTILLKEIRDREHSVECSVDE